MQNGNFNSIPVSPRFFETEYIFGLSLSLNGRFLAICGTGYLVAIVDIGSLVEDGIPDPDWAP